MSRDESVEEARRFVERNGLGGFRHVADTTGDVLTTYAVNLLPAFIFGQADGTLSIHVGELGHDGLAESLDALVAVAEVDPNSHSAG
ncbi:MAG: hypothetical protein GY929_07265 [Actinomycetia bacterium]|nr:hypothetical protein [Actinomycetes bacterium]